MIEPIEYALAEVKRMAAAVGMTVTEEPISNPVGYPHPLNGYHLRGDDIHISTGNINCLAHYLMGYEKGRS